MRLSFCLLLAALWWSSCGSPDTAETTPWPAPLEVEKAAGIAIPIYDYPSLAPLFSRRSDSIYIINFWATWCIPCVEELPYFERLQAEQGDRPLKVVLVNMDFRNKIQSQVIPFVQKRKLQSQVIFLNGTDPNSFISKIDPKWSGALPATIVQYKDYRYFHEGSMTYEDLMKQVEQAQAEG